MLNLIGSILLLIGIVAAFYGPLEIYCYTLFTEGGRFHYEGFGFGSFMFGNITFQIMAYYIIALVFIPLGYGHLKKQSWIQPVSLSLLWCWLIMGIPLLLIFLFILVASKEPTLFTLLLSVIFLTLSYTVVPFFLMKFYKSENMKKILQLDKDKYKFIQKCPVPVWCTIILYFFYIFIFHMLLLFKGLFPFFGKWLLDFTGFIMITISILFFIVLILGTFKLKLWAWWCSVIYFSTFAVSLCTTLFLSTFSEIVRKLEFPPTETDALINIPLQGIHLCLIFGLPVIASAGAVLFSKKYFTTGRKNP